MSQFAIAQTVSCLPWQKSTNVLQNALIKSPKLPDLENRD
jgi:hypothetical protein